MKKSLTAAIMAVVFVSFAGVSYSAGKSGEELFNQHCAMCHPDGGNIVNPEYTLHKEDLQEHKITKAIDIVGKMRHPGPGMTEFDKNTVSDKDAKKIAEYILKTFK